MDTLHVPSGDSGVPAGHKQRDSRPPAANSPSVEERYLEAEPFLHAWHEVVRALQRARGRSSQTRGSGLTPAQFQIMVPLLERPLLMTEVAIAAGVAGPTATRAVASLAAAGLVERTTEPGDKRQVRVKLSKRGQQAVRAKRLDIDRADLLFVSALTSQQLEQGAALLSQLATILDLMPPT